MNVKFASGDEFDIEDLSLDMMARQFDLPTYPWRGPNAKMVKEAATWHFYEEDRHFTALRKDAEPVIHTPAYTCVEPNFSIAPDTPRALALGTIYWKRNIARYWQTEGKRIIVDLHVPERFVLDNLRGVPHGWKTYATRGTYGDGIRTMTADEIFDRLDLDIAIARKHAGTWDVQFIVFAGGRDVAEWCKRNGAIHSPNRSTGGRGSSL